MYVVTGGRSQQAACIPAIASRKARCVRRPTAASTGTNSVLASRISIAAGQPVPAPSRAAPTTVASTTPDRASYTPSSNNPMLRQVASPEPSASQSGWAKCFTTYDAPSMTTRSKPAPDLESVAFSGSRSVTPASSWSSDRTTLRRVGAAAVCVSPTPGVCASHDERSRGGLPEGPAAHLPDDVRGRTERVLPVDVGAVVRGTRGSGDEGDGARGGPQPVEDGGGGVGRAPRGETPEKNPR